MYKIEQKRHNEPEMFHHISNTSKGSLLVKLRLAISSEHHNKKCAFGNFYRLLLGLEDMTIAIKTPKSRCS